MAYNLATFIEDWELYKKTVPINIFVPKLSKGDSIHIKSRRGCYIVHSVIDRNTVIITCKKWQIEAGRNDRNSAYQMIHISDFQCYQGSPFAKKKIWN